MRTALQALSAVLGGTQSLHTNSMDEALGLPTEHAALLALRTQQVIAHETGGLRHDRSAGRLVLRRVADRRDRARGRGSTSRRSTSWAARCAPSRPGFQQREIHDAAYAWQKRVESGDAVVVGVNRFVEGEEARPPLLRVDEALQRARAEKLRALRARRDGAAAERALAAVEEAARGDANLMPPHPRRGRGPRHAGRDLRHACARSSASLPRDLRLLTKGIPAIRL